MEEIVRECVWWEMDYFTVVDGLGEDKVGGTGGAAIGDGCTIGGVTTLGGGNTLGGGTTLGDGDVVGVAAGGASVVVFVVQLVKRLRSLEMDNSCLWRTLVAAFLTAQDRKLRAWTILSSGLTSGWVR